MFSKRFIFPSLLAALFCAEAGASLSGAEKAYRARGNSSSKYRVLVIELTQAGRHFAAIPYMKEYLAKANTSRSKNFDGALEKAFEEIVAIAGPRQFETLPMRYLAGKKSNSIRFIRAKKYLRSGDFAKAIREGEGVNPNHPIYPFVSNLLGAAYANLGKTDSALKNFQTCQSASKGMMGKATSVAVKKQLEINHDTCVLGVARSLFGAKKYKEAELKFLDIQKASPIWPEVLFEEAWNSYYLGNYNRTLGKLVTYNAPVFDYVFRPEIETLKALTYLKMCLYADAKAVSDDFYNTWLQPARRLRVYLKRNRKDYKKFYRMMVNFESSGKGDTPLLTKLLKSVERDPAYQEVRESLIMAAKELEETKSMGRSSFRSALMNNLNETLRAQRDVLGAFVKSRLVAKYAELYRAFEGMSYIKLEVLEQRKARLYRYADDKGKRGDVKYIERNEKQYFWNFNGEFWADELGDYVFALGSEC